MSVCSADEFYSIMGVLTREMMEFGVTDTNELVKVNDINDIYSLKTNKLVIKS